MKSLKNIFVMLTCLASVLPVCASGPAGKKQKNESGLAVAIPSKEAFIQAIKDGDAQKVDCYLEHNNDVDLSTAGWEDAQGMIPLMHAGMGDSLPVFMEVLFRTKNLEIQNNDHSTTLEVIAKSGGARSVQFIQQLIVAGAQFYKALTYAVNGHNRAVVIYVLEKYKNNINWENRKAEIFDNAVSSFFRATTEEQKQQAEQIIHILLQHGANVQKAFNNVIESIAKATNEQQKEEAKKIAKFLLQQDANIEHRDDKGFSLMNRIIKDHQSREAVAFLLDCKADIEGKNSVGQALTPLLTAIAERNVRVEPQNNMPAHAAQVEQQTIAKRAALMRIIELLIERDASLGLISFFAGGTTSPLLTASYYGDFEVVKFLGESGASLAAKSMAQTTALDEAKKQYVLVQNADKQREYKHVIDYLINPLEYTDAALAGTLVQHFIYGPLEDRKIVHRIKVALGKNSLANIESIFTQYPQAYTIKDVFINCALSFGVKADDMAKATIFAQLAVKANQAEIVAQFVSRLRNDIAKQSRDDNAIDNQVKIFQNKIKSTQGEITKKRKIDTSGFNQQQQEWHTQALTALMQEFAALVQQEATCKNQRSIVESKVQDQLRPLKDLAERYNFPAVMRAFNEELSPSNAQMHQGAAPSSAPAASSNSSSASEASSSAAAAASSSMSY